MKLKDIYDYLDTISAFNTAEDWDNCGILIGDEQRDIKDIVLSIDIDEDLISSTKENSLIITHHPLIFKKLKTLNFKQYPSKLIEMILKKNISHIAMHTNFDKSHLNEYVLREVLAYEPKDTNEEFIKYFDINEDFDSFVRKVKSKLNLDFIKFVKTKDFLKTGAITTGSGASLINNVKADCFLTGDIKYHEAMEAMDLGLSLIDIEHYSSEKYFALILYPYIKTKDLNVKMASSKNPFSYY